MADLVSKKELKASIKHNIKLHSQIDELPKKIEQIETQIGVISLQMSDPQFYQSERNIITQAETQLADYQQQLSHCYQRWEILEP